MQNKLCQGCMLLAFKHTRKVYNSDYYIDEVWRKPASNQAMGIDMPPGHLLNITTYTYNWSIVSIGVKYLTSDEDKEQQKISQCYFNDQFMTSQLM